MLKCFISYCAIVHDKSSFILLCFPIRIPFVTLHPFPLYTFCSFPYTFFLCVCVHSSILYFVCLSSLGLLIGHLFCFFIFEVLKCIIPLLTLNTCHAAVSPVGFMLSDLARCPVFLIFTHYISFVMFHAYKYLMFLLHSNLK